MKSGILNRRQARAFRDVLLFILFGVSLAGATPPAMTIVKFPLTGVLSHHEIEIGVASATLDTVRDSVRIRVSPVPGGGDTANYSNRVNIYYRTKQDSVNKQGNIVMDTAHNLEALYHLDTPYSNWVKPVRGSDGLLYVKFRPNLQFAVSGADTDFFMTAGRFYYMVEAIDSQPVVGRRITVSDERFLIVETDQSPKIVSPSHGAIITTMAPYFEWQSVAGVPYYHMLLSDRPINLDNLSNASIVWQALTAGTSILYGTPDPSGQFPDPPPLSPDNGYQWLVLNNYGGTQEYTSKNALPDIPPTFTIKNDLSIRFPDSMIMDVWGMNTTVVNDWRKVQTGRDTVGKGLFANDSIKFVWSKALDTANDDSARLYRLYLYIKLASDDSSNPLGDVGDVEVLVSQYENTTTDTFLVVDAKSFMMNTAYTWKVFAEQANGAAVTSDTTSFRYFINQVTLDFFVGELLNVAGKDAVLPVVAASIAVEALDGSLNNVPVITSTSGYARKVLPAGRYRFTTRKSGFISQSRTVETSADTTIRFVIDRSPATLFVQVFDSKGNALDRACVLAVSDRGDSSAGFTDSRGSYTVNVD